MGGIVILGIGAVIGLLLLARLGRNIVWFALVMVTLVIGVLVAAAMTMQGAANYHTATAAVEATRAAQVASLGTLAGAVCVGGLGVVTVAAIGAAGWFYLRWRWSLAGQLPRQRQRPPRRLPKYGPEEWFFYSPGDGIPAGVDLSEWGW